MTAVRPGGALGGGVAGALAIAVVVGLLVAGAAVAQAATVLDDSAADFSAGTNADTVVRSLAGGDGAVELKRTFEEDFAGAGLPPTWTSTPWPSAGTATVAGGALSVDGARADSTVLAGPGSALQFTATFGKETFQHVGFATDFDLGPWAIFSTGLNDSSGTVHARTFAPGGVPADDVLAVDGTHPHAYRIDWSATGFAYYVDGALAKTHAIAIPAPMRPQASDLVKSGVGLSVDSLVFSTVSSGTFTSRVLDGGATPDGLSFATTSTTPAGTGIAFETRTGSTATPDGSWSAFEPVGSGGAVASPARRYLQYRATLTTTDVATTPALGRVAVGFAAPPQPPGAATGSRQVPGGTAGGPSRADKKAPRVGLRSLRVRVSRRRSVALTVACPREERRCTVTLRLRHGGPTLARNTVTVPGGASRTLTLRLPARTFRSLVRRGSQRFDAFLSARDAAGNAATVRVVVRLVAPRR